MKKFLTARWEDLIMVNYEVDTSVVLPCVPLGTELDLDHGKCFVSLVAFMFRDTRVLGVPIPFHVNFEEVNLRFYIKRRVGNETRRAVCFIKEIVPRRAIATVARVLYGEPYEYWSMGNVRHDASVAYNWEKGGVSNHLGVETGKNLGVPASGSHGEFIIEHYWGYTTREGGRVDEYKVEHPKWDLLEVGEAAIDANFVGTYGAAFGFLDGAKPFSVLFTRGSTVTVYMSESINI